MSRIPSATSDQGFYFVALDALDYSTFKTGLASWTIYRSRNGAAEVAMTAPTVTEIDATNVPGVYWLLCDEDMTLDAGDDEQEMCYRITASGMVPVTKVIEVFRPKFTAGSTASDAATADAVWDEARAGHSTAGTYGEASSVIYSGQVSGATTTTTLIDAGLTQVDVDHWIGRVVMCIDGANAMQARTITAFDPATDKITFNAMTTAPTAGPGGTRYIII